MLKISPLTTVSLFHLLNDGFRIAIIAFIPYLADSLGLSYTQAGLLGTCLVGIQALSSLPASLTARKKGDFLVLRAGLLLYSVAILSLRLSFWYVFLLLIYCLAGVGFSAFHPVGSAFVAKNSPRKKMGKNLGMMTSAGDIGKIFIPALGTCLLANIGWQPTTSLLGGLGILALIASCLTGERREKHTFLEEKVESFKNFIKRINRAMIKRNAAFGYALGLSALDCFTQEPINIFLPFLAFSITNDQQVVGITLSSYFAGSLVGKNILGILTDKKSGFFALVTAEVGLIVMSVLIGLANNIFLLYFLSFILGIFSKGTSPVIKSMLGDSVRSTSYNLVFGLSETTDAIAAAASPLFFGFIADLISLRSVFLTNIVFISAMIYLGFLYQKNNRQIF